jgi:hypothetical protein
MTQAGDNMRRRLSQGNQVALHRSASFALAAGLLLAAVSLLMITGCAKPEPLTREKAESLIRESAFSREPVYAEVPMTVRFGPRSPMDDFDGKSVRTFQNLKAAGLINFSESHDPDGTATYVAKVTQNGFHILGTAPSARGPALRGRICEKVVDGIRDFQRHPTNPLIGRAELAWHYDHPTDLYPMFETKINKPLKKTFLTLISFYWKDRTWNYDVIVRKTEVE